jgi:3-carboxy-cis,cis-muconate cycloisomerase
VTDLCWPGDHLAGDPMSDAALLRAMLTVEQRWLDGVMSTPRRPLRDATA